MDSILGTQNNFRSLSMKDLLEARDQYHYHLMNKANVVGTAVGLYLIRKSDPEPGRTDDKDGAASSTAVKPPRTLLNSEVRNYSWPCVLAFVNEWVEYGEFGRVFRPESMVPKTLYLPDGRMVPVCVVKVEQAEAEATPVAPWPFTTKRFAPGMPLIVESQGVVRHATAGCLVTDGNTTYAMTNRHVTGETGETIYAQSRGRRVPIGKATKRCITRLPFSDVYPQFPTRNSYINIDVGLVELADLQRWTTQRIGLPRVGPLADLNQLNITTRLINAPVQAYGAASGHLNGRIKALFYRYKSIGGYDYVSDFLIAPEEGGGEGADEHRLIQTRQGDSGMIWHLVTAADSRTHASEMVERDAREQQHVLRPLAMEWGGQTFSEGGKQGRYVFALATSLTTISRALDVELINEHDVGAQPFWGQTGHYTIATVACDSVPKSNLATLLNINADRISFTTENLDHKAIVAALKKAKEENGFIPLADVPDMVWKTFRTKPGGRDTRVIGKGRTSGPEHPTHFADIDEPDETGTTLRDLSLEDPVNNLTVEFWRSFYTKLGHTTYDKRGLLPFRVWQFFNAMTEFARDGDATSFVCAAGLLAHYVGDACQPLHGSMFADGFSDRKKTITHKKDTGEVEKIVTHFGKDVHSTYESAMIDRSEPQILEAVERAGTSRMRRPKTGHDAALLTVELMNRTAKSIDPSELINAFEEAGGTKKVAVQDALWEQFGERTVNAMIDGAHTLAAIWIGAWDVGEGDVKVPRAELKAIDEDALQALYEHPEFIPSLDLDAIGRVLT